VQAETFCVGVQRVANPVRQSRPAAGSESCVVAGRPFLRSAAQRPAFWVDSECAGRVIEPRNQYGGGGRRLGSGGRQHRRTVLVWCGRSRRGHKSRARRISAGPTSGVVAPGTHAWGLPRNLGDPVVSGPVGRSGVRLEYLQAPARRVRAQRERTKAQGTWYRQAHECQVPPECSYRSWKETKRGGTDGRESERLDQNRSAPSEPAGHRHDSRHAMVGWERGGGRIPRGRS